MKTSGCVRRWLYLLLGLALITVGLVSSRAIAYALDKNECLLCHSNPGMSKTNGSGDNISLHVDSSALDESVHKFIDCTQCHSTPHQDNSALDKLSLAERCGSCHLYEREQHEMSIHGQELAQGNEEVASCVDCHSTNGTPHSILPVLSYDSPTYRKNIADTCSRCHGNEELMASYGIVEKVYESYMRSFHGKAMRLGSEDIRKLNTATCTNCHGVHNIMETDHPDAPVASLTNLVATCEQCHPGAGENFAAGFLGHTEASPQSFPAVYYTERFFLVFTASVVTGGISLVTLAVIRSLRRRQRKDNASDHDVGYGE